MIRTKMLEWRQCIIALLLLISRTNGFLLILLSCYDYYCHGMIDGCHAITFVMVLFLSWYDVLYEIERMPILFGTVRQVRM